jgi:hypothetical protein
LPAGAKDCTTTKGRPPALPDLCQMAYIPRVLRISTAAKRGESLKTDFSAKYAQNLMDLLESTQICCTTEIFYFEF